jgi:hypothetical protein
VIRVAEEIDHLNAWLLKGGISGTFTTLKAKFTALWQLLHVLVNNK